MVSRMISKRVDRRSKIEIEKNCLGKGASKMSRAQIALLILAVATFALAACAQSREEPIVLPLLDDKFVHLSEFEGQVVLVFICASWRPPCQTEMPIIQEVYDEYRNQGLVVLGVNHRETASQAQVYAEEVGVTFPIILDRNSDLANHFLAVGLPVTIILDSEGEIVEQIFGLVSRDQLGEILDPLIGEGGG